MDTDVRRGARLAALAILVALTVALVQSVELQRATASPVPAAEARMRQSCHERLRRAVAQARASGDAELADWIESLPIYNPAIPTDAPARPAAP